jgi:hypothetical protein
MTLMNSSCVRSFLVRSLSYFLFFVTYISRYSGGTVRDGQGGSIRLVFPIFAGDPWSFYFRPVVGPLSGIRPVVSRSPSETAFLNSRKHFPSPVPICGSFPGPTTTKAMTSITTRCIG